MQIKRSERQERANEKALATINMIKKSVEDANGDMSVLNNLGPLLGCSEYQAQCRLGRYLTYLCEDVSRKYLIGEVANFSMKVYKTGPYRYSIQNFGEEWGFAIVKLLELLGLSDKICGRELVGGEGRVRRHITFMSKKLPEGIEHQFQLIYNKTFEAHQEAVLEVEAIKKQIKTLELKLKYTETNVENISFLLDNESELLRAASRLYLA